MQHTLIEAPPSDGQIYRKIRQYSRQNDAVAERQWWTRLGSENKRRDLKRLLRHERYTTALDTLLDIPGLWEGVRGGMWKKMMDLGCEEEVLHYLEHIRVFWSNLLQNDTRWMQRLDHVTVTALECRAPGQSTNDLAFVHGQVQEGALFHAFNERERDTMLDVLKSSDGLVPSFHTFFEDLKFLQIWGQCAKTLKRVRPRGAGPGGTVFTALEQAFDGTHQHIDHCVIQQSEFVFTIIPGTIADRVDLGYRQLFLYVMRHHREMIPGSTRMELKGRKKLMEAINVPKEVDRLAWRRFAALANRLGFASAEIASLKSPDAAAAAAVVEVPSGGSNPSLVSEDSDEPHERRCGRPFDLAYEQSQDGLFLDHVHRLDKSYGRGITPFFVRRSVYLAFLGRPPLTGQPGQTEPPTSPSPAVESKLHEKHDELMDEPVALDHVAWSQD